MYTHTSFASVNSPNAQLKAKKKVQRDRVALRASDVLAAMPKRSRRRAARHEDNGYTVSSWHGVCAHAVDLYTRAGDSDQDGAFPGKAPGELERSRDTIHPFRRAPNIRT